MTRISLEKHKANIEKRRAYMRKYYAAHKEEIRAKQAKKKQAK